MGTAWSLGGGSGDEMAEALEVCLLCASTVALAREHYYDDMML